MENSTFKNPPALKLPVLGLSCPRDFFFFFFFGPRDSAHRSPSGGRTSRYDVIPHTTAETF